MGRSTGLAKNFTQEDLNIFYLGIDQHRKPLAVCVRDEKGGGVLRRQVSTQWDRVRAFFADVQRQVEPHGGFVAIDEVCGFNDWLGKLLDEYGCRHTLLVQPPRRGRRKTDRRDAALFSVLLWINRRRLVAGQRVTTVIWHMLKHHEPYMPALRCSARSASSADPHALNPPKVRRRGRDSRVIRRSATPGCICGSSTERPLAVCHRNPGMPIPTPIDRSAKLPFMPRPG